MSPTRRRSRRTSEVEEGTNEHVKSDYHNFKSGCLQRLGELGLEPHTLALRTAVKEIVGRVHREYPHSDRSPEFWKELGYQLLLSEPELLGVVTQQASHRHSSPGRLTSSKRHNHAAKRKLDEHTSFGTCTVINVQSTNLPPGACSRRESVCPPATPERASSAVSGNGSPPSSIASDLPEDLQEQSDVLTTAFAAASLVEIGHTTSTGPAPLDEFLLLEVQRLQKQNQELQSQLQQARSANMHLVEQIDYFESNQSFIDELQLDLTPYLGESAVDSGQPLEPTATTVRERLNHDEHLAVTSSDEADCAGAVLECACPETDADLEAVEGALAHAEQRWKSLLQPDTTVVPADKPSDETVVWLSMARSFRGKSKRQLTT